MWLESCLVIELDYQSVPLKETRLDSRLLQVFEMEYLLVPSLDLEWAL